LDGGGHALSSVDDEAGETLAAIFGVEGQSAVGDVGVGDAFSSDGQSEVAVALVAPQLSSGGGSVSLALENVVGRGGQFLVEVEGRGGAVGLVFSVVDSHESFVALLASESSSTDNQSSGQILDVVIGSEIEFELGASRSEQVFAVSVGVQNVSHFAEFAFQSDHIVFAHLFGGVAVGVGFEIQADIILHSLLLDILVGVFGEALGTVVEPSGRLAIGNGGAGGDVVLHGLFVDEGGFESRFAGAAEDSVEGTESGGNLVGVDYSDSAVGGEGPVRGENSESGVDWGETLSGFVFGELVELHIGRGEHSVFLKRGEIVSLHSDSNEWNLGSVGAGVAGDESE